ncbi:MAG: hypothetical protein KJN76_11420 [Eudoraea sp.]|nr:hypothetical protein [Eudoraea sp.]
MAANTELLDQLSSETDKFLTDLIFFKRDIAFIELVFDRYFRTMRRIENLVKLRRCVDSFRKLERRHKNLHQQLKLHHAKIGFASRQKNKVVEGALIKDHLNVCLEIPRFISEYQLLRKEILSLANTIPEISPDNEGPIFTRNFFSLN